MVRRSIGAVPLLAAVMNPPALTYAQDVPAEYQQALSTPAKQGDFTDNVLKVNSLSNDVKITVAGVATLA